MRKLRLIFIDASELTRALFSYVFEGSSGMEIVGEAADRASAIEIIRQLLPDAIIIGYEFPELDRFCSWLKAEFPRMRIIGLSELDKAVERKLSAQSTPLYQYSAMVH